MKINSGFTLIELLILVMLIAIVVTISTPRFSSSYKSLKTKAEAQKITDFLKFARNRAVQEQATLKVFFLDSGIMEIQGLEDSRMNRHKIDPSVDFEVDPESVSFFPNGMMTPFTILLSDSQENTFEISAAQNSSSINRNQIMKE